MAKVPLYYQNQLASSQVGTPGVYNAVSNELGNVATEAGSVGNTVLQTGHLLFEDQLTQRRQKEAEIKAYNKVLGTAQFEADLAEKTSAIDKEFTSAALDIKNKSNWDTTNVVSDFSNQTEQIKSQFLDGVNDPLMKAKLQTAFSNKTAQYVDGLGKWAETRQVPIMESKLNSMAGNFSTTVGNAGLQAGEVGQKIKDYHDSNSGIYNFVYGQNAQDKMRNDVESGVMNYLSSTALNAPDLLEDRIKAFSGGSMIDPSKLNKFAGEQRRIAAEVKAANAAQDAQQKSSVQLASFSKILDSSPTGNLKDADPQVIHDTLTQNAPYLTNDQNIRLQELTKQAGIEAQKNAEKAVSLSDETRIASSFGNFAKNEELLSAEINSRINGLAQRGVDPKKKFQNIRDLQLAVDRYQDGYSSLKALKDSITNKNLKGIAELHLQAAEDRFGETIKKLKGDPTAIQTHEFKTNLYAKIYPPTMFPDAKKQGMYNYIYQQAFSKQLQDLNIPIDKQQSFLKSQDAVNAIGRKTRAMTEDLMRKAGVLF